MIQCTYVIYTYTIITLKLLLIYILLEYQLLTNCKFPQEKSGNTCRRVQLPHKQDIHQCIGKKVSL